MPNWFGYFIVIVLDICCVLVVFLVTSLVWEKKKTRTAVFTGGLGLCLLLGIWFIGIAIPDKQIEKYVKENKAAIMAYEIKQINNKIVELYKEESTPVNNNQIFELIKKSNEKSVDLMEHLSRGSLNKGKEKFLKFTKHSYKEVPKDHICSQ